MSQSNTDDDVMAIRDLVQAQAQRLSWTATQTADWDGYKNGFMPFAAMIASARPARPQAVVEFLDRMKALSKGSLKNFEETALGGPVCVFGNVAVALIAGQTIENGSEVNRDVSGYLLIKEDGRWRIAAQAWDKEKPGSPIPPAMLASS